MIVKDPSVAAKKWSTRAQAAGADYTSGVANTQKDQAALAVAAAPVWAQSVQTAAANGTFAKGVNKAGTAGWKAGVAAKGAQRYPQGVGAGGPNYQAGVTPYFTALSNLQLPPRGVKGTNMQRVQVVADALMKTKAAA
jgi:hypothetical protein